MKNKKGFTLVELLAVIVILAVIILIAVNAVLPQMNRARKNSFADEALNYLKAAETKYVEGAMDAGSGGTSYTALVGSLNGQYVSKSSSSGYRGKVVLTISDADDETAGNVTAKHIWLTDCKKYMIINKTADVKGTDVAVYDRTTWNALFTGSTETDEQCPAS